MPLPDASAHFHFQMTSTQWLVCCVLYNGQMLAYVLETGFHIPISTEFYCDITTEE